MELNDLLTKKVFEDLAFDLNIKNFLKLRMEILLRAHQRQLETNQNILNSKDDTSSLNLIFINRLIDSEINLICLFRDYLNSEIPAVL